MTFPRKHSTKRRGKALGAAGTALVLTAAMIGPLPAMAAPGDVHFSTSFEDTDADPVLEGTGEAVNVSSETMHPASILPHVAQVTGTEGSQSTPAAEGPERAADGNPNTKWLTFASSGILTYELSEAQPLAQYRLTSANDEPARDPKVFTVEASNDGEDWIELDSQDDVEFTGRFQTQVFTLNAVTESYEYYRLNVIETADPSNSRLQIADWEPISDTDEGTPMPPSDVDLEIGNGPVSSYTAKTSVGWTGLKALGYSASHIDAGPASSTSVLYDELAIDIVDGSQLSYMVFPNLDPEQTYAATFVAVDLVFDDNSTLSASGATDIYGYEVDARTQGYSNKLWPDQWNKVTVDLSQFQGRTVEEIHFTYDHPGDDVQNVEVATGDTTFSGWIDDIVIDEAVPLDTSDGLVSYVDTRRGTNSTGGYSRGNNIPAAAWPNGFNFIVPFTNADTHSTIYHYQQNNTPNNLPALQGIGFSHQPSIWMQDRNQLAVMPAATASPSSTLNERRLEFRHENETARPDIYAVEFENGLVTAVAPTDHGAVYEFTFTGDEGSVIVDHVSGSSSLTISDGTVTGWVEGGSGYPGRTRMFVYGTFDATPTNSGATPSGNRGGARYAAFDTSTDKTVELRLASSFISVDQAQRNHALELEGRSFEEVHNDVKDEWNDRLSAISNVQGATDTQLVTLYSSLYRLNLYPNSQHENVGTAESPKWQYASPVSPTQGSATDTETNAQIVDGKIYVNNGFWDTYRTAWPLYGLLYPELSEELVDGFIQQYRDGGWVSRWSAPGYADLMTGTSSDVAFAEVYMAGSIDDIDLALETYDAALKNATVLPESNAVGRKGLNQSIFLGYTQAGTHESASWGLEGFINDYGIANMAADLAERDDVPEERRAQLAEEAEYFQDRANHFVEMYNPEAGVFTARNADGSWPVGADFDKKVWGGAYTEASGWTFAFHAPHNVDGMAALYGGRDGLLNELNEFLTERERADYSGIHEAREARDVRRGMLGISNQVAHHIPYVLAEAGDPSGAQELIRDLQNRMFVGDDIGQGYPGDEDNGEFSAWYIFSALGFYPLEVGSGDYTIGTPLFDSATLNIGDTSVTVNAPGASDGLTYVDGVDINGTAITDTTFDGDLLRAGGTVTFDLSASPSDWGAKDLTEELDVPDRLVDATRGDRGVFESTDGQPVGALVDDNMNSSTVFESGSAELVWTTQSGPVTVSQYTLTSAGDSGAPQSWTLSGSVDGSTWVELDSRTDQVFQWDTQTRPFSVAEDNVFTHFKLDIESGDGELALAEVELFASSAGTSELTVTPTAGHTVAVDEEFTGALATITGEEESADGYTVSVNYGDGSGNVDTSLVRDDLGGWRLTAPHTFDTPGLYTAAITVSDSSGTTVTDSTTVNVVRDHTFEGSFTMVCIGDYGLVAPDCDQQGYGYDRQLLADEGFVQGETHPVPGYEELTYDLPALEPGAPDNLTGEGQTVYVDLGEGATQLTFIGAATENNREPEATLHFTDGTTQTVEIEFGDWVGASTNLYGDNVSVALTEKRLSGTGWESTDKDTSIYATAPITIDTDDNGDPKVVEWLTMPEEEGTPRDGRVHVFAIASDGDRSDSTLLEIEAGEVGDQIAGEAFEAGLATISGGVGEISAVVNWGDGSDVTEADIVDGVVVGGHTYTEPGTYTVRVTVDDDVRSASVELEIGVEESDEPVLTPEIELSETEAAPGDVIGVAGVGFAPGESVEVRIGDAEPVVTTTDDDGNFSVDITVPSDAIDGVYPVVAVGATSGAEASANLTVRSSTDPGDPVATSIDLAAEPTDLVAGDSLTLTATVSPSDAVGHVEFVSDDEIVGTATVGGGTAEVIVVVATSGEHTFTARFVPAYTDDFLPSESAPVTVEVGSAPVLEAELSLSEDSVAQGESVDVTGRGYGPGEEVTLTLHSDPVELTTVTVGSNGTFEVSVTIPSDAEVGEHTIEGVGADTELTASATLTVTAADDGSGDNDGTGDDDDSDLPTTGGSFNVALTLIIVSLLVAGGLIYLSRRNVTAEK